MTPTYSISEEIARWTVEVYFKQHAALGWWLAFTNPTAGPWKKIVAQDEGGFNAEIYRFQREEERPDLVLVNDELKLILLVEAKDFVEKLVTADQMEKSIRVIKEMNKVFLSIQHIGWGERAKYRVVSSFLWVCQDIRSMLIEDKEVRKVFQKTVTKTEPVLNIIVTKDEADNLFPNFIYDGQRITNPNEIPTLSLHR